MQPEPIEIGSERQLFLDELWLAERENVRLAMHPPLAQEVALVADRPWESAGVHYSTVIEDGGRYRMWYRCDAGDAKQDRDWRSMMCYAESSDGIRWEKPNLGLVEWEGSRENNIVLPTEEVPGINGSVIVDPNAEAGERYKMITRRRARPDDEILGFVSDDGLSWRPVESNPLLTGRPFDSHNILLWDDAGERFLIYLRGRSESIPGAFRGGHRSIRRSESSDFFHGWSEPETVVEGDGDDPPGLNFYTNACTKYARAAQAFVMFPMILYTEREYPTAPAPGLSDVQFVFSRDGITWERPFREPYVRPGLDERNWVDRNPIMGPGILETGPGELSMYYTEFLRSGGGHSRFRRSTIRTDGFVSVEGPYLGWGEFVTPPLTFSGGRLELNYSTSGGGSIFVELQDQSGKPLPGFSLEECEEVFGDMVEGHARWSGGEAVGSLAGRPVRLRFQLRDAHLYAFKFGE